MIIMKNIWIPLLLEIKFNHPGSPIATVPLCLCDKLFTPTERILIFLPGNDQTHILKSGFIEGEQCLLQTGE